MHFIGLKKEAPTLQKSTLKINLDPWCLSTLHTWFTACPLALSSLFFSGSILQSLHEFALGLFQVTRKAGLTIFAFVCPIHGRDMDWETQADGSGKYSMSGACKEDHRQQWGCFLWWAFNLRVIGQAEQLSVLFCFLFTHIAMSFRLLPSSPHRFFQHFSLKAASFFTSMSPTSRFLETGGIREGKHIKEANLYQDSSNCGIVTSKGTGENFKGVRSPEAQSPRPPNMCCQ